MIFNIRRKIKKQFQSRFKDRLLLAKESTKSYASDLGIVTPNKILALFFPVNEDEVIEIVQFCFQKKVPFSVRGGGTGKTGSFNLVIPGILISMEKMLGIELFKEDMIVKVESGVINKELQDFLIHHGLFFPVDPASLAQATIGGNISTNAGGPRSFKYGVMGDYVLQLNVILPNGEKLILGSRTRKNTTGYSLKSLFVGSGGTLGIITSAILKVIPYPAERLLLNVGFKSIQEALATVIKIYQSGICPSAIEFMERRALELVEEYYHEKFLVDGAKAILFIEIDGALEEEVYKLGEKVKFLLKENRESIVYIEEKMDLEGQKQLWKIRRDISPALQYKSLHKRGEDIVVPPSQIQDFMMALQPLKDSYGIEIICFGHLGDGNIHLNILNMRDESSYTWETFQYEVLEKILHLVLKFGGTLSGEHGIGLKKKKYLSLFLSEREIQIHKDIKKIIDPHHLLNPKKIW